MSWSTTALDTVSDYFCLTHPNPVRPAGSFRHRLGNFQCGGIGARPIQAYPRVGVLHVPVSDFHQQNVDHTAENVASFLASHPSASTVHATSDRDSGLLLIPADAQVWGCGNPNTARDSWEIEIAGWGPIKVPIAGSEVQLADYWRGPEGLQKLRNAAQTYIRATQKAFGKDWKFALIPLKKAKLSGDGTVMVAGWTQHAEVPFFYANQWWQPPVDNIAHGQHCDICPDFPFDSWFVCLAQAINEAPQI